MRIPTAIRSMASPPVAAVPLALIYSAKGSIKKGRGCPRPEFREETPKKCVTAISCCTAAYNEPSSTFKGRCCQDGGPGGTGAPGFLRGARPSGTVKQPAAQKVLSPEKVPA